jgi:hypothetical protein
LEKKLERLSLAHGKIQRLVSDNGPEFRALNLTEGVEGNFVQPGSP